MKRTFQIIIVVVGCFLTGCFARQHEPTLIQAPLRLTQEEVLEVEDGNRIIVYFPNGVERPVVFKSVETGGWVVSGKVIDN